MNENTQEIMESVSDNGGVSDSNDDIVGNGSIDSADTVSIDTLGTDSTGNEASPNVWNDGFSDVVDSVSSGDINYNPLSDTQELMAIQEAFTESNAEVVKSLSAIHSLLVLIFAFLLFEWTEKKLKVTVNRFTDKLRK